MFWRFLIVTILCLGTLPPIVASADESEQPGGTQGNAGQSEDQPVLTTNTGDDGQFVVGVGQAGGAGSDPVNAAPAGVSTYQPTCTWVPVNQGTTAGVEGADDEFVNDEGGVAWFRTCPGGQSEVVFVLPSPDPITLVQPATDRARAQLPAPIPNQNPAPDIGSFVNLGLWMSIDDPGTTTARATVANVWAEATGTFVSFHVDPGDGTGIIQCAGFGEAYTAGTENPDEGPCGHTYLQRTDDSAPHTVTYTITYDISWTTSDGRSGNVGTFDRSFSFPFDIDEIQIVGTGNGIRSGG